MVEFCEFQKIPRLFRDCILTEKIDGTNAQIYIVEEDGHPAEGALYRSDGLALFAGSRTRWVTPEADNHGFAAWALAHGDKLLELGPGRHFGEWWGKSINRGYGLQEKRFSLFNVSRWRTSGQDVDSPVLDPAKATVCPMICRVVPVLYYGPFSTDVVNEVKSRLRREGSQAASGFMRPEGVVVFHKASGRLFKSTLERDEEPKGVTR